MANFTYDSAYVFSFNVAFCEQRHPRVIKEDIVKHKMLKIVVILQKWIKLEGQNQHAVITIAKT